MFWFGLLAGTVLGGLLTVMALVWLYFRDLD